MPKSGDLPNQSRNRRVPPHDRNFRAGGVHPQSSSSVEPSSREGRLREFQFRSPDRPPQREGVPRRNGDSRSKTLRDRPNLWRWLFGQNSQRTKQRRDQHSERVRPTKNSARPVRFSSPDFSTSEPTQEVWQSVFPLSRGRTLDGLERKTGVSRISAQRRSTEQSQSGGVFRFPGKSASASKLEDSRRMRQDTSDPFSGGSERLRPESSTRAIALLPAATGEDANSRNGSPLDRLRQRSTPLAGNPSQRNHPISLASRRDARNRSASLNPIAQRTATDPILPLPTSDNSSAKPRRRDRSTPRPRSVSVALYLTRILILGLGVGVLAGTMLSVRDPASRPNVTQQAEQKPGLQSGKDAAQMPTLGQEMTPLKAAIQALAAKTPQLTPGIFVMDLDGNAYVDHNGATPLPAASTIKVPILIAFFQDVDAGKIRLDELLTLRADLIAKEAGDMQYQPVGTRYTALETANKMITISDNTATNLIIARIGGGDVKQGMAILNQRFKSWGLSTTALNSLLPDLGGTNITSARDLSFLMARLSQGDMVSLRSRDRLLDIMRATENNSLLPQGLGEGATISHKTGGIGTLLGDTGLVDLPNGKRYTITTLVKRPPNNEQAYDLIQQTSRLSYQYLIRPTSPNRSASPAPQPSPSGQASPRADAGDGQMTAVQPQ